MKEELLFKFGAGEWGFQTPVCYPNVYAVEKTTGPERLIVGPAGEHVELLLSLAELLRTDYYILYVLLAPRLGNRNPGRYQSPAPLSFEQVASFCRRFAPFLQGDGRHNLWVGSTTGLLVYDRHEWIWAYGDLPAYTQVLQTRGFTKGEVVPPATHTHHFNAEFDAVEEELAGYWEWLYFPLQPSDD